MLGSAAFRTGIAPGGALAGPWVRNPLWTSARAVPSLDLNFAGTKTLDSRVTFTRASIGTYVGSDGLVKTAATDEARFDHNPTTGESLGLLVEEARTNVIWPSADYSGANWVRSNIQISAATTTAPDGSTCFGYEGSSASSLLKRLRNNFATTTVGTYTWSIYLKAGTENSCAITIQDGTGLNGASATILLTNGTVTTAVSNAGVNTGAAISVQAASNGFYRVSLTSTFVAALTQIQSIITWDVNGASTTTGTLFPWAAQLEAGAFATSYISTTSATVTRAADVASITGSNFSSWYNQAEGTVFSDSTVIASQVQTQTVWQLGGGTILTSLRQPQGTSNQFRALIGGTFTASPGTGGLLSAGTSKAGVAYLGTAGRLQVASSGADATGSSLDANKLDIGSLNPGTSLNGTIKRLTYWPVRLPNTSLQAITQ